MSLKPQSIQEQQKVQNVHNENIKKNQKES